MSSAAIGPSEATTPAGELAIATRVQQIEALLSQAQAAATGAVPAAATTTAQTSAAGSQTDFASALQAASAQAASSGTTAPSAYAPATGGGAEGGEYEALIQQAAERNGLEPAILHGLIQQESDFDPSSQSSAGAMGLTQLMPGTASSLGVADPMNPAESIEGGARYLSGLMREFGGNATDALAAYNAGPGAVRQYGGVPPYAETQDYVTKVLGYAEAYRQSHPQDALQGALA